MQAIKNVNETEEELTCLIDPGCLAIVMIIQIGIMSIDDDVITHPRHTAQVGYTYNGGPLNSNLLLAIDWAPIRI